MNYDFTLMRKANVAPARAAMPDVVNPKDHIGLPIARTIRWRQSVSAWLHQLAERVAPHPIESECDELFESIAAMLAEPICEVPRLKTASQQRC